PAPVNSVQLAPNARFNNTLKAYLLVLCLAIIWTAGPLIAPIGVAHGWVSMGPAPNLRSGIHFFPDLLALVIRSAYGRVCHQLPERSLWIQGQPMAVCARCFGIYLGYFIGLLACPLAEESLRKGLPRLRWLMLALVPLAIDFAGGYFGVFQNTAL